MKVRSRGSRAKIVFVTAYEKYVFLGYRVNAVRYLIKPIMYVEFIENMKEIIAAVNEDLSLCIYESRGSSVYRIYYEEIIFIETEKKHTVIHLINDSDIVSYKDMEVYEKALADSRFYRCHSSFLVNMDYISEIKGLDIILKKNELLLANIKGNYLWKHLSNILIFRGKGMLKKPPYPRHQRS